MKRSSLVVLNIGLLIIIYSAVGADMQINYPTLVTGVAVAAVGLIMLLRSKKKKKGE